MAAHGRAQLDPNEPRHLGDTAGRLFRAGMALGVLGLAAVFAIGAWGGEDADRRALFAYLVNFAFFISIPIGGLLFVLVHMLCKTGTITTYRRLGEIVAVTLPVFILLAIPILAGVEMIYPWTHAEDGEFSEAKHIWLSIGTWVPRIVFYLLILSGLAVWYFRASVKQDESGDPAITLRMQARSTWGVIIYALIVTAFVFDLIKSLDPHWFSTIFGVYYFAGGFMAFHCVLALFATRLQKRGILARSINVEHYHDIGKMMFAFVVFWTYIAFSQYMLIWYANIPEETIWYIRRGATTDPGDVNFWTQVLIVLLVGHFFIPFLGMLSRWIKRDARKLVPWAVWLLVFHWIDMAWLIRPELADAHHQTLALTKIDAAALAAGFVGIGGVFLAVLARCAGSCSLIAQKDPRLAEGLVFENF